VGAAYRTIMHDRFTDRTIMHDRLTDMEVHECRGGSFLKKIGSRDLKVVGPPEVMGGGDEAARAPLSGSRYTTTETCMLDDLCSMARYSRPSVSHLLLSNFPATYEGKWGGRLASSASYRIECVLLCK
jgi:hypothetical protein